MERDHEHRVSEATQGSHSRFDNQGVKEGRRHPHHQVSRRENLLCD